MEVLLMSCNLNPREFFEELFPQYIRSYLKTHPIYNMDGLDFSAQFNILGEGGGVWSLLVKDAREVRIIPAAYDGAQVTVTLSLPDWRWLMTTEGTSVDIKTLTNLGDYPKKFGRPQYEVLQYTYGELNLESKKDDGTCFKMLLGFNQADFPILNIKIDSKVLIDIGSGEVNPMELFRLGKIQYQGDLNLLLDIADMMPR